MRLVLALCIVAPLLGGCIQEQEPPPVEHGPRFLALREEVAASTTVRFETTKGTIDLIVYQEWMPGHGARFLELVEQGFYDNTQIHRVVDDFVVQGGDPTGLGEGGSGQTIPHEHHPLLPFGTGALGMARDEDPDSGDSQWFITERPVLRLSDPDSKTSQAWGTFAMFGQVVAGMDVVRDIADEMQAPQTQRPLQPVLVTSARVDGLDWDPLLYPRHAAALNDTSVAERPLHVFADHAFPVTVTAPAREAIVRYTGPGGTLQVPLVITEEGVWQGETVLEAAGTWDQIVYLDDVEYRSTFEVHPPI